MANGTLTSATAALPMMKIRPSRKKMTMWPASMLAKSRMVRAKGLVNRPRISTGIMIGQSHQGTPPVRWLR